MSSKNAYGRGDSKDRRNRKQYLINTYGDGETVRCWIGAHPDCSGTLTAATLTVDRVIPGCCGGSYQYSNCRPACGLCNRTRYCEVHQPHRRRQAS